MDHYRLRKYRGPETWARVREAYVAGEPAASVCLRFDVTVHNLRKKASREGWTRSRVAAETDLKPIRGAPDAPHPPSPAPPGGPQPPSTDHIDPETGVVTLAPATLPPGLALERALTDAARRLAEGRATEALALMRAAETLASLTGAALPTLDELDAASEGWEAMDVVMRAIQIRAADLAGLMLSARDLPAQALWHAHYLWRAERLGPEVAAADHARAVESGDADRLALWEADGQLKPLELASDKAVWAVGGMVRMSRGFDAKGTLKGFWGEGGEVAAEGATGSVTA